MPYATVNDLKVRYGQDVIDLLDRNGDGEEDNDIGDTAIAEASAEIDTLIASRYPVPLTSTVPWLQTACCDLARYRLYDDQVPEVVKDRRADVIKHLERIAKGVAELIDDEGKPVPDKTSTGSGGGGALSVKPRERIFSDDALKGYMGP